MKQCLIVYESYHHGNTKKIAEAMAEVSGAELCPLDELAGKDPGDYEIIGLGAGIAYGRHYKKLMQAAGEMKLDGKPVFVFSTSGTGNQKYNRTLAEQLAGAGAKVIGDFTCKGFDTMVLKLFGGVSKGHPDAGELSAAKQFILEMYRKTLGESAGQEK